MYYPHQALLYTALKTAHADGGRADKTYATAPVDVACMIEPTTPDTAFRATGVEMNRPHRMYCSVASGRLMSPGDKLTWAERDYYVHAIAVFEALPPVNHAEVWLQEADDA